MGRNGWMTELDGNKGKNPPSLELLSEQQGLGEQQKQINSGTFKSLYK